MTWSRFDDAYDEHEKVQDCWHAFPPNPVGLHVMATTACNRWLSDGVIRPRWITEKLPKPSDQRKLLGHIVEVADRDTLFSAPRHPYTRMLLDAIPDIHMSGRARTPVQGEVPNPLNPPGGCTFHPRCPLASERCRTERPPLQMLRGVQVACHAVEEGRA